MKKILISTFILLASLSNLKAQRTVIDKIVAVVGEEIILKSDIENAFLQEQGRGLTSNTSDLKGEILEQQLIQKLLVAQAKVDTVEVGEDEVEMALSNQLDGFIRDIGSQERLEAYFGKPLRSIRDAMRSQMRERLITERMREEIVSKIRITPSEVKSFYKSLSKDSLPDIPDKYEIQQICLKPAINNVEKERIRERLRGFREQILKGESTFNTLAVLYSEGPSAPMGGELGYVAKTTLDPAFAEAAFSLKEPGKISKIVESEFGFHIIQLIDRKGDKINVRHILLQPEVSEKEKEMALGRLDSISNFITTKVMTFEEAALYFSNDKQTKNNGGIYLDPMSGESKIARADIPGEMAKHINTLKPGEISSPFVTHLQSGMEEFKIIKIKQFYPQHKANLEDDWSSFEQQLMFRKESKLFKEWIVERQKNTYVHIDPEYRESKFQYSGWIK